VVIGGGASGTLVTAQLIRQTQRPLRIKLIERRPVFGRGIAYSTPSFNHLLNVPAKGMSAYPDQPEHLLNWLKRQPNLPPQLHTITPMTFVPRRVYGTYLQDTLKEALSASSLVELERIQDEVIELVPTDGGVSLRLQSGRQLVAQQAILTVGNFPPGNPAVPTPEFYQSSRYIADPWANNRLATLNPDEPVMLLGTGLTAVDVIISLHEQGHRGPITAVSRRGLLPQTHVPQSIIPVQMERQEIPLTALDMLRWMRTRIQVEMQHGGDWRNVIDAIRPHMQDVWETMPEEEKSRFLRHVQPYWDVRRHRVAPNVGATIQELQSSGQLQFIAGRVRRYDEERDDVVVTIARRHKHEAMILRTNLVVNCTGPVSHVQKVQHSLLASLLQQGTIRPGPIGLGIDATTNGAVKNAHGKVSDNLWVIGSLLKGVLWETIAIPELRCEADTVASDVLRVLDMAEVA
jgi:uncharacterized NAD(P)/FAD-binding protein YdhS